MIVGSLAALILILVVVVFVTLNRLRNKKFFRSPNSSSAGFPSNTLPHLQPESVFSMGEKGGTIEAYGVTEIDDYRRSRGTIKSSLRSTLPLPHPGFDNLVDNNDYQEPYQAFKYAPYYSYSSVVMEMQDVISETKKPFPLHSGNHPKLSSCKQELNFVLQIPTIMQFLKQGPYHCSAPRNRCQ